VVLLTTAPAHGAWRRLPVAPAASGVPARSRPVEVDPPDRASAVADLPAAAVAPVGGAVVRPFDPPASPYGSGHRGVDLAATPGELVRAALPGTVTFAGVVAGRAWVTVAHGDGLRTTYGALRPVVVAGQRVVLGQPLGRATARGTVDWGARRDGAYVDPMALLGIARVRLVPVNPAPGAG
jgi:murein DD-endopeptidase MepM/ murein hydrolase activator NlpD